MSENLGKNIAEIFRDKYVIPLYQRNYAWREDEIVQLLQDIFVSFKSNSQSHYYIGSLVVLKRRNGIFEVIDGQQRLTTLSLIVRLLEKHQSPVLSYDSRPAVEKFFETFFKKPDEIDTLSSQETFYLKEAVHTIKESVISNGADEVRLSSWSVEDKDKDKDKSAFADFLMNNVYLVRVEIPEDTDVASYFEIMNNRGEQLQKHEILKALMMAELKDDVKQKTFAKIWDACSQMNVPIQKMFSSEDRKTFFGENYDSFDEKAIVGNTQQNETSATFNIDNILKGECSQSSQEISSTIEDPDEYRSIIDWPNFLMHVLKLYKEDIPLNEKFLLSYKEVSIDKPWGFIQTLLYCRVVFDCFVVKQKYDPEKEDGFSWTLTKPKINGNQSVYENSFDEENLIKVLSMLQVTYRSRTYKNWLFELLKWFYNDGNKVELNKVNAGDLLKFLNKYVWVKYSELELNLPPFSQETQTGNKDDWVDTYCAGTGTPHFLFNFIDYLYWLKKDAYKTKDFEFKEFDFKYWNSVEHHLAQNKAANIAGAERYIDNLGNLCLISKSSNSRLSDRVVQEKVDFYGSGNIGPKRQRMYAKTETPYTWGEEQICAHYKEVCGLLNEAKKILGVEDSSTSGESIK